MGVFVKIRSRRTTSEIDSASASVSGSLLGPRSGGRNGFSVAALYCLTVRLSRSSAFRPLLGSKSFRMLSTLLCSFLRRRSSSLTRLASRLFSFSASRSFFNFTATRLSRIFFLRSCSFKPVLSSSAPSISVRSVPELGHRTTSCCPITAS